MKIYSSYKVKIKHYNRIFDQTIRLYRDAVDFFIDAIDAEWDDIAVISASIRRVNAVEKLTIRTAKRPSVKYDFGKRFYKFPSYMRRAAISEALGMVSSYRSNLDNWTTADPLTRGRRPAKPRAGHVCPAMYRDSSYVRVDDDTARIKVFMRNTWDWLTVSLRRSDVE